MKEKRRRVRVVESYTASNPDPLNVRMGEKVTLGKRDDEWPGWIWCTDARGQSSWIYESLLQIAGDHALMKEDYDATELTVSEGEELTVLRSVGGWLLCETENGEKGWIPEKNATPLWTYLEIIRFQIRDAAAKHSRAKCARNVFSKRTSSLR
ncbi:hypothetical protein KKH27_10415 [bacterium]|nr:hypothetical protein [bacterium]MBU1982896.1 hypothetical protein [bacterium]